MRLTVSADYNLLLMVSISITLPYYVWAHRGCAWLLPSFPSTWVHEMHLTIGWPQEFGEVKGYCANFQWSEFVQMTSCVQYLTGPTKFCHTELDEPTYIYELQSGFRTI